MGEQQQDIAQKIAAARHLSESLKDKIRAKKEQTADSTRKLQRGIRRRRLTDAPSARDGCRYRSTAPRSDEAKENAQGTPCKDIRYALVGR